MHHGDALVDLHLLTLVLMPFTPAAAAAADDDDERNDCEKPGYERLPKHANRLMDSTVCCDACLHELTSGPGLPMFWQHYFDATPFDAVVTMKNKECMIPEQALTIEGT